MSTSADASEPAPPAAADAGPAAARPLRRDAERNRRRILDAAAELFADRGLDVTMDDIADRAGVGVGTVYRRFADKEELIDALFDAQLDAVVELASASLEIADPWDGLVHFFEGGLAKQSRDRGLKQLLLDTRHGGRRVARQRERIAPLVEALVERAKAAGALRADAEGPDMAMVHVMLGAIVDFTHDVAPDAWRRMLGLLLDGLRVRRDGPTPLDAPALDAVQLDGAMRTWLSPRR